MTFATAPAVGGGSSLTAMPGGSWLHSSTGSDQLFRLRDLNADGDVDDTNEVTLAYANAAALLSNPDDAGAGAAPLTPAPPGGPRPGLALGRDRAVCAR